MLAKIEQRIELIAADLTAIEKRKPESGYMDGRNIGMMRAKESELAFLRGIKAEIEGRVNQLTAHHEIMLEQVKDGKLSTSSVLLLTGKMDTVKIEINWLKGVE